MTDLFSPEDFDGRGEEEVIGRHTGLHASGIELQEGLNTSTSRNYCANCKRNIHCFVKVDKETGEAIVHKTCRNDDCECKCKTHYACRQCGYLHPYGQTECNRTELEVPRDPEADKRFNEIMDGWRKEQEEKKPNISEVVPQ